MGLSIAAMAIAMVSIVLIAFFIKKNRKLEKENELLKRMLEAYKEESLL